MRSLLLLNSLWNWRLLPDRLQRWLFGRGTRAVEVLSALALMGFALAFWIDTGEMTHLSAYYKFLLLPEPLLLTVFGGLGGLQLLALSYRSCRSQIISGFLLIVSGLVWAVVSASFWAGYPPMSTAMTTYPILAVVCLLGGRNLMQYNKRRLAAQAYLRAKKRGE